MRSRPRLLGGVARQSQHAGQRRLAVRLLHGDAPALRPCIERAVSFLQTLLATAEQLDASERWRRILRHLFAAQMQSAGPEPPALACS